MVFFLLVWLPSLLHFPLLLLHFRKEDKEEGLDLRSQLPKMATLVIDTDLESKLPVEEFTPGYLFRLEPGESVPLDAVILTGSGFFDESDIGGQETKSKGPGAGIYAGTVNKNGKIIARTLRRFEHCKINTIIQQRLEDRAPKAFLWIALAIGLIPFCFARSIHQLFLAAFFASPSGFFLSQVIPYRLTRQRLRSIGLFYPNEKSMMEETQLDSLIFNPYLALSQGRPVLKEIRIENKAWDESRLLTFAFGLSRYDDTPLHTAITQAAREKSTPALLVEDWNKTGASLSARVDNLELQLSPSAIDGHRALALHHNNTLIGNFVFTDSIIPNAKSIVDSLAKLRVGAIASAEATKAAIEAFCAGLAVQDIYSGASEAAQSELPNTLKPRKTKRLAPDENLGQYLAGISLIHKKRQIQRQNLALFLCYIALGSAFVFTAPSNFWIIPAYLIYQLLLFIPILNAMRL